jgi:hypothetical protein
MTWKTANSGSTPAASTNFASRSRWVAGRLGFDRQPAVAALGTTPANSTMSPRPSTAGGPSRSLMPPDSSACSAGLWRDPDGPPTPVSHMPVPRAWPGANRRCDAGYGHSSYRDAMPSPGGIEFGSVLELIVDRLDSTRRRPRRPRPGYLVGRPGCRKIRCTTDACSTTRRCWHPEPLKSPGASYTARSHCDIKPVLSQTNSIHD